MIDSVNPIISIIGSHMTTRGAKDLSIELAKSENHVPTHFVPVLDPNAIVKFELEWAGENVDMHWKHSVESNDKSLTLAI